MDLSHLPALEPDPQAHEPRRLRGLIAKGSITGTSRGLALGYLQCNLAMVPQSHAGDFLEYCKRNARACPVLEVTAPGHTEPRRLAPGADLRTDCARYAVWQDGQRQADRQDISALWRADLVSFLIGSGITFDDAFEEAGITHADVDHLMIYDAFAHLPLYGLEDLGFCKPGEAKDFIRERNTAIGGKLPLNTNGGGLSYMHSGMYGMYALQESVRQMRGTAAAQVQDAKISIAHGVGGMFAASGTIVFTNEK
jgi:hypothetical protein